ncbi:MAG: 3-phosphoglycerate dehydrogenase [Bacteroidota bacterium]
MTVLVADAFSEAAQERLRAAGHAVHADPALKDDALAEALAAHDPAVLVVRSTRVTAAHLDAAPALELVVRAGAGVDTIDVEAASQRGVFVANCPGKNASAVAELAFGLILSLDRRIPDNVIAARAGRWDKKGFASARGLRGRTLGLVGMGHIGREMAARARAFGMPVVAWSRSLTEAAAADLGVTRAPSVADVARQADVVSVHVAFTPETRHLVDGAFLAEMTDGAFLVNTARAEVVDEQAVAEALAAGRIRYATDVPAGEPQAKQAPFAHPLAEAAYLTHHVGASTDEATEAIGQEAARVILTYAETGRVENGVNLADQTPATHLLTVPTSTAWACSRACSARCARRTGTCRRWRTWSSPAPRRRARASASTARPTRPRWPASATSSTSSTRP